ncbi:MAG: hypothetical protein F6K56_27425 [Moorea sp. SIO3G5]|nr:hypothetical protein [Moorena sp. SIO3G5]
MGIKPILRVLCNGHLAWNWHLGRTGILPVSIDVPAGRMPTLLLFSAMGILRGTGILPVSCLFLRGQDAHSTPINSKTDATPP